MPVEEEVDLAQAYYDLAQQYRLRMDQLMMVHTVLAILVEEQGGLVVIDKELYDNYDLHAATINMYDPENGEYLIEVKVNESGE